MWYSPLFVCLMALKGAMSFEELEQSSSCASTGTCAASVGASMIQQKPDGNSLPSRSRNRTSHTEELAALQERSAHRGRTIEDFEASTTWKFSDQGGGSSVCPEGECCFDIYAYEDYERAEACQQFCDKEVTSRCNIKTETECEMFYKRKPIDDQEFKAIYCKWSKKKQKCTPRFKRSQQCKYGWVACCGADADKWNWH